MIYSKRKRLAIFFLIGCICSATSYAEREGNGGRTGQGKLVRAKQIAIALVKKASIEKIQGSSYSEISKAFFKRDVYLDKLQAIKLKPVNGPLYVKRGEAKVPVDAIAYATTSEVDVDQNACDNQSEIDLALLILHETGHLLDTQNLNDEIFWEVANAIADSVETATPMAMGTVTGSKIASGEQESQVSVAKPKLIPLIEGSDSAYAKYLIPFRFPHEKVTESYDKLEDSRRQILMSFAEAVRAIRPGPDGIYTVFSTGSPQYLSAYREAVRQAIGPSLGLKVASNVLQYEVLTSYVSVVEQGMDSPVIIDYQINSRATHTLRMFIVLDPKAGEEVEIIKAESFRKIEEMLHRIRKTVTRQLVEDSKTLEVLSAAFENKTEDAWILEKIKQNRGNLSVIELGLKQMTIDELRELLPRDLAEKKQYLASCIAFARQQLDQALTAQINENTQAQKQKVDELLSWLKQLSEELTAP